MSVDAIPIELSHAIADIHAQRAHGFRHLESSGIRKSALDAFERFLTAEDTLSRPSLIVRCRVNGGDWDVRVVVDKPVSHTRLTETLLPFVQGLTPQPRGCADFFLLISDNVYVSAHRQQECLEHFKRVPFLRCDQSDDDRLSMHTIQIPDFFVLDRTYADELTAIERAVAAQPFETRIETIKWRGSLHGSQYANDGNYAQFRRYTLLMLSLQHPDIVDARLTNYNVEESESGAALRKRLESTFGQPADALPAQAFVAYKYLISTDGVGAGWKRLPTILASGSVLLMQHRWTQFFYPGLKPWVHYVPVDDDLSDLIERYRWLTAHPSDAQAIAGNGLRFARTILTPTALATYFREVVERCGELYRPGA
jgi:hypothetical protein